LARGIDVGCWFELWDAANGRLVGPFQTREAAPAVMRHSRAKSGDGSIRSLVLTAKEDSDAAPDVLADGPEVVELVGGHGGADSPRLSGE